MRPLYFFQSTKQRAFFTGMMGEPFSYILKLNDFEDYYTWDYNPAFEEAKNVFFLYLMTEGKTIEDFIPQSFIHEYQLRKHKFVASLRAAMAVCPDLKDRSWWNILPKEVVESFCKMHNTYQQLAFDRVDKKTPLYDFRLSATKMLGNIASRQTSLGKPIIYNLFGTKTGRLTTITESLPILLMKKEEREKLSPQNDYFLSVDFSAFEPRVALALSGQPQPVEDIHQNNMLLMGLNDVDEAKKQFFAWFYNPERENSLLEKKFERKQLLQKYYVDGVVTNPYGKKIIAEENKAFNYLVQSTAALLFLEQSVKVYRKLRNCRSYIAALIHDNIILDMSYEDDNLVTELLKTFSETRYGTLPLKVNRHAKN